MKKTLITIFAVALFFTLVSVFWKTDEINAQNSADNQEIFLERETEFNKLIDSAEIAGEVRVIVRLNTKYQPEGNLRPEKVFEQRRRIRNSQAVLRQRFRALQSEKTAEFKYIPFIAAQVDAQTLREMKTDQRILSIEKDEIEEPTLAESVSKIGGNLAFDSGFSGSGQTIAVIDTGVDKNHPFLSGKVVSEGCYSSNVSTSTTTATSLCPDGVEETTAADSALNCDPAISGCSHGTHVAGIAAGRANDFTGVAKDANIVAFQVFSKFETGCSDSTPCTKSFVSNQIKALERIKELSETLNIAAVNMSLGGGQYTEYCDSQQTSRKAAIDELRSVGIATVVSAGNSSYTDAVGAPACISTVVSVGSTDDGSSGTIGDEISGFSNSVSFLNLLAPGRWIRSSIPNGSYSNYSGTSMAAPHAAGAFAVLKQSKPDASVTEILNALITSGTNIKDTRNDISKPRIQIDKALLALNSNSKTRFDFDGDRKTDIAIFRPAKGEWWYLRSLDNSSRAFQFGSANDKIVPADYTGDGKTDSAFFRPSSGEWFILRSEDNSFYSFPFGAAGDIPAPADFDGDGKADPAIFRPATATWYILKSTGGTNIQQFGVAEDVPQVADFDGDGKADLAVFRPTLSQWWISNSAGGVRGIQFGAPGDKPVAADYTGDGKTDIAIWRPSNGSWFVLRSEDNSFYSAPFGQNGDIPAAGDFDGDGKSDLGIFRSSNATWYLNQTTSGSAAIGFGQSNDKPVPAAFIP